jgi:hypothetical protein
MPSGKLGTSTSAVEVTNVSTHGLWVLVGEEELFLPFAVFPWFAEAPVSKIANIDRPGRAAKREDLTPIPQGRPRPRPDHRFRVLSRGLAFCHPFLPFA